MSERTFQVKLIFKKENLKRDFLISIALIAFFTIAFAYFLKIFQFLTAFSVFLIAFFGSLLATFLLGCYINELNKFQKSPKRDSKKSWSVLQASFFMIIVQVCIFSAIFIILIVISLVY